MRARFVLCIATSLVTGCYLSHERPDSDAGAVEACADPLDCLRFVPANVDDRLAWSLGLRGLSVDEDMDLDTDTGAITTSSGRVVRMPGEGERAGIHYARLEPIEEGGAPLGVFVVRGLSISARLTAHGRRALVLMAARDSRIDGVVSASASASGPGPCASLS
ncbi:MAG: hypothetical protein K8H88_34765, partial [Sandaracinaceae bacterium]|nr:hypothetical protein [Sandaracinaceae bacterium]